MSDRRPLLTTLLLRPSAQAWRTAGACLLAVALSAAPLPAFGLWPSQVAGEPLAWLVLVGCGLLVSAMAWSVARTRERERKAHRETHAAEALYRSVFEQAGVGIIVADGQARVIHANRKMGEILGRTPQELVGQTPASFTHPDDQANAMEQVGQVLRGDLASVTFEKRYLRPDGHVVWTRNTATRVVASQGAPDCFMAVIQDISASKQAQAERDLFSEAVRLSSRLISRSCVRTSSPCPTNDTTDLPRTSSAR